MYNVSTNRLLKFVGSTTFEIKACVRLQNEYHVKLKKNRPYWKIKSCHHKSTEIYENKEWVHVENGRILFPVKTRKVNVRLRLSYAGYRYSDLKESPNRQTKPKNVPGLILFVNKLLLRLYRDFWHSTAKIKLQNFEKNRKYGKSPQFGTRAPGRVNSPEIRLTNANNNDRHW